MPQDLIAERLEAAIADSDRLSPPNRAGLAGGLKTRPTYNRFLRVTPKSRLLRIDRTAIAADAKLDGKFLLRTSDLTLDAEDVALDYKQLLQFERGWGDLKLQLDLRPVFHRREDRIRPHVLLRWLALLVTRIAKDAAGDTWRNLRRELHQLAVIESAGPDGTIVETTRPTPHPAAHLHRLHPPPAPAVPQHPPRLTAPAGSSGPSNARVGAPGWPIWPPHPPTYPPAPLHACPARPSTVERRTPNDAQCAQFARIRPFA